MKHSALLRKTRDLLSDPARWIKGQFARNRHYGTVPASHPDAACWCLAGALEHCMSQDGWALSHEKRDATALLGVALETLYGTSDIILFNDSTHTTHADIIDLLDEAIRIAESA